MTLVLRLTFNANSNATVRADYRWISHYVVILTSVSMYVRGAHSSRVCFSRTLLLVFLKWLWHEAIPFPLPLHYAIRGDRRVVCLLINNIVRSSYDRLSSMHRYRSNSQLHHVKTYTDIFT